MSRSDTNVASATGPDGDESGVFAEKCVISLLPLLLLFAVVSRPAGQSTVQPDWPVIDDETMRHFQALVRMDTSDPPGAEKPAADYIRAVLERDGIPVEVFALEPNRPNVVARLKGSGRKRPLLIMGHTDTVNVDPKKWNPPRLEPCVTEATSTGAGRWTTRTTSSRG